MRIAMFTDAYVPQIGGVSVSIERFAKIFSDRGHSILIVCPRYKGFKGTPIKNIEIFRAFAITPGSDPNAKFPLPRISKILRITKKFNPDIIHIHTPMGLGWIGLLAAKVLKIPNFQTYHTFLPEQLIYFRPSKLLKLDTLKKKLFKSVKPVPDREVKKFFDKWKAYAVNIRQRLPHPALSLCWGFTKLMYNDANLILSPSHLIQKELIKHKLKPPIEVLSNGIEFASIPKRNAGLGKQILHVGRLGPEKRVDVVIKAMAYVVKKEPGAMLHLIGPGPFREEVEALTKRLGLQSNVVFHGPLPREELLKEYKNYDLFVTASPMETQGLVILEAMAAGLPVVGIKKLAVPEVVISGKNGYIAKPFVAKEMASYILKIISDQKLWNKLSAGALEMAHSHDITNCANQLEQLYSEALENVK